jgi:ADP-heptose:LPS heptosyltransferase
MDRIASCTPLPGLYAEKFKADIAAVYIKRTGFCRGELCIEELSVEKKAFSITVESNRWLEQKLKTDIAFYENWLWMHDRWKAQVNPEYRFRIEQKFNYLAETCKFYNWKQLPKRTHVWVRFPNLLGDCIMMYPALLAIRHGRPDFYLHAVVPERLANLVKKHFPVDHIVTLPNTSRLSYFKHFWNLRYLYPDVWINFSTSARSDIEAFCSGAPQRFCFELKRARPLMTHKIRMKLFNNEHQTQFLYRFLQHFGLSVQLLKDPFFAPKKITSVTMFGCFLGSDNSTAKCWPVNHWQQLIQRLLQDFPKTQCLLLGSETDRKLCITAAKTLPSDRVQILAGKTDLMQLEKHLQTLDFVIANDSGGLHLSNALGLPTVALFGPTRPEYSAPFFDSPTCVIRSPTNRMEDMSPDTVFVKVHNWLDSIMTKTN